MKLYNDVYQLLSESDCVIIPNFGGFVTNYCEAKIDLRNQEFCPPEKKLAFNESLQNNDGLLMNHICSTKNVKWEQANEYVISFVTEINDSLKNNQTFTFEKLGQFTRKSGTLVFTPFAGNNLLESSFGLSSFHFPMLKAEKAFVDIQKPKQLSKTKSAKANKPTKSRKTVLYILASAAAVTGIVALSFHFGLFDTNSSNKDFANIAPVEVLINSSTGTEDKNVNNTIVAESDTATDVSNVETINKEIVTETNPELNAKLETSFNSHVIAGSFSEKENAYALESKLTSSGFPSRVISGPNGMYRVSVKSFENQTAANSAITDLRQQTGIQSLWVLNL